MATDSSVLVWKTPGTEEPGQLQLMGCKESDTTERLVSLSLFPGNSLAVQWLGLCTLIAKGPGSIPDGGTKIPEAARH